MSTGYEDIMRVLGGPATGAASRPVPPPIIVEGRVLSVTSAGIRFTVPSWDNGRARFGPAPWAMSRVEPNVHDHTETLPAVGDRCLVIFVPPGTSNPWVVAWWPA